MRASAVSRVSLGGIASALVTAPYNTIAYAPYAAQWDDASTNAGNASVIYLNSSLSLDAFVNTVADPGTRTTPTDETVHYLMVVGGTEKYLGVRDVVITTKLVNGTYEHDIQLKE